MINDKSFSEFLAKPEMMILMDIDVIIGKQGEKLASWQLRFNQLNAAEMHAQYHTVVSQLIQAKITEQKRIELFEAVTKINERLLVNLYYIYKNQSGILNETQQQALDMILSTHYLGIIFYNSIWQRVVNRPEEMEKRGLSSLFGINNEKSNEALVKHSLYGMMSLLRQALFEKQIGYRKDTQIIWQWLNTCYRFVVEKGWQNFSMAFPLFGQLGNSQGKPLTLSSLYYQCLLSEVINPYACRRSDMQMWQKMTTDYVKELIVTTDLVEKPYLFVNLQSNEPPKLWHADVAFNPFSKDSECLFLGFSKLIQALQALMSHHGHNTLNLDDKSSMRFAKLMLINLKNQLTPPETLFPSHTKCQCVGGFHHIHYMLSNKTSLSSLIHANELPDRLKPKALSNSQMNKSTTVLVTESNAQQYHLTYTLSYTQTDNIQNIIVKNDAQADAFSYVQVGSIIAIRLADNVEKVWHMGKVEGISQDVEEVQTFKDGQIVDSQIDVQIRLFGQGVPCGIRLYNAGNRPQNFVPALMIPKNEERKHPVTTIMMARFGYQFDEKLIMRIDDKEVNIRLTELINITDDIEEYAFVRVQ